jgi:hypothetical protein
MAVFYHWAVDFGRIWAQIVRFSKKLCLYFVPNEF